MDTTTARIDPATVELADDEPDDLERLIAELSVDDPGLPARIEAAVARQEAARAATQARRRRGAGDRGLVPPE